MRPSLLATLRNHLRPVHPVVRLLGVSLAVSSLFLGGCATRVTLPPLGDCHPASAAAATVPIAGPSQSLASPAPLVDETAHGKEDDGTMDHGTMDHGTMDHGTMDHGEDDHAEAFESAEVVYSCPMHPEVGSPVPGRCPICGMNLERSEDAIDGAPVEEGPGAGDDHDAHDHGAGGDER